MRVLGSMLAKLIEFIGLAELIISTNQPFNPINHQSLTFVFWPLSSVIILPSVLPTSGTLPVLGSGLQSSDSISSFACFLMSTTCLALSLSLMTSRLPPQKSILEEKRYRLAVPDAPSLFSRRPQRYSIPSVTFL